MIILMSKESMLAIGQSIKALRKKAKLTQFQLGEKVNKTESTIRKYEAGDVLPPIDVIENMAMVLKTTPFDLLGAEYWDNVKYQKSLEHQPPIIQYLCSLGYTFEYVACSEDDNGRMIPFVPNEGEILPPNQKRLPCLLQEGKTVIFKEEEFEKFQAEIKKSIEYLIWQQGKE